jgi:chromosome segregation ATPase
VSEDKSMPMQKATLAMNFNIPTLLSVGGVIVAMVTGWADVNSRIENMEAYRADRSRSTDANFAAINMQLGQLSNIPYRVQQTETRLEETGKRIDRLSETIINSLDNIRKDLNGLSTRVEVMSGKLDTLADRRAQVGSQPGSIR